MIKNVLAGFIFVLALAIGCGGPGNGDPLIGMWTQPSLPIGPGMCQFAPNGAWTNGCMLLSGWPSEWTRIDDGEYYLGIGNGAGCDAKGTFSNGNDAVTLTLRCGSTQPTTANLVRFRP
ncbi:MAG TPA: hypothetical protein VE964_05195 [Myxococcales bacterium]|nr:hypothetical protein [Myxococcales bacterium]